MALATLSQHSSMARKIRGWLHSWSIAMRRALHRGEEYSGGESGIVGLTNLGFGGEGSAKEDDRRADDDDTLDDIADTMRDRAHT